MLYKPHVMWNKERIMRIKMPHFLAATEEPDRKWWLSPPELTSEFEVAISEQVWQSGRKSGPEEGKSGGQMESFICFSWPQAWTKCWHCASPKCFFSLFWTCGSSKPPKELHWLLDGLLSHATGQLASALQQSFCQPSAPTVVVVVVVLLLLLLLLLLLYHFCFAISVFSW